MAVPTTRNIGESVAFAKVKAEFAAQLTDMDNLISSGTVRNIGRFIVASNIVVSADVDFVRTSGYTKTGIGAATYVYDATVNSAYVTNNPFSSFMSKNNRGYRLVERDVDVNMFGAVGDGVKDDTVACQRALDWMQNNGGGVIKFSRGKFRTTAPLNIPSKVSIDGEGPCSIIFANGCHGLNILKSDDIGPRRIANVWIYGNGGENYRGITFNIATPDKVTGLVIENIYISFFGEGIAGRGMWHSTIRSVTINQVHIGIFLYERNIKVNIDDCRITRGGAIVKSGNSVGIQIGDETVGLRPEDVQISLTMIYEFTQGILWRQALFGGVNGCDIDYCTGAGLVIVTADGGFTFNDNWVHVGNPNADVYGIQCVNLGYTPSLGNILISNNNIKAKNVKTVPGEEHSYGMFFGDKQSNFTVSNNCVVGDFQRGIWAKGARISTFTDNKIEGDLYMEGCTQTAVRDNYFGKGITFSGNTAMSIGKNLGLNSTKIDTNIVMPAGATSVTVSYLSLNIADLPMANGGYNISCTATDRGDLGHGNIRVKPGRTSIQLICDTALGADGAIGVSIGIY